MKQVTLNRKTISILNECNLIGMSADEEKGLQTGRQQYADAMHRFYRNSYRDFNSFEERHEDEEQA